MDRRNRTTANLEEQKRLLQDPSYTRTIRVWTEKDGERQQVERKQRVFRWWRVLPNSSAVLSVRVAQKPIDFEKGKAGIGFRSNSKALAMKFCKLCLAEHVRSARVVRRLVVGEKSKIDCAAKHYAVVGVDFRVVTDAAQV